VLSKKSKEYRRKITSVKNYKVALSPTFLSHYHHLKTIQGTKFPSREIDDMACLLSKKDSKTIAQFLSIEEKTVETRKYKLLLVKRYYLKLLIQEAFEEHLQKILCLIDKRRVSCSIVCWKGEENKSTFIDKLLPYLKLAGIKICFELRENYKLMSHLVHKIESHLVNYALYIPSFPLIHTLAGHKRIGCILYNQANIYKDLYKW